MKKRLVVAAIFAVLLCSLCSLGYTATTIKGAVNNALLLEGTTFFDQESTEYHKYYLVGRWDSYPEWGFLELDECNSLGMLCRTIYQSEAEMDLNGDIRLEIDSHQNLNMLVDGETIFRLKSPTR